MTNRANQVVLTTGANSGLGLATVIEVARRGFRSVGSVRSPAKADIVAQAGADAGVEVETVILDVTDAGQCREVVDSLRPYGLVNNAGYLQYRAVEDVDDDDARHQMETLVVGPTRLARLALPHMREAGGGRIVQVSSMAVNMSTPLMGWYQGSKLALEGITDALRMEVASSGVAVVLVEPGAFRTGLTEELVAIGDPENSRYAEVYQRARKGYGRLFRFWSDPHKAASVIATALTTRYPRARYFAGYDAKLSAWIDPFTPTLMSDRAKRLLLGL
jgi:NAD(P)-dependent dehydrogenase (short-subunit alcohol dehydrogenase family)